jgi:hypothetical protein
MKLAFTAEVVTSLRPKGSELPVFAKLRPARWPADVPCEW